jgi:hypothetical protein
VAKKEPPLYSNPTAHVKKFLHTFSFNSSFSIRQPRPMSTTLSGGFGKPLGELVGAAKLLEGHFLGSEMGRASLDLLALGGTKFVDDVVHVPGHVYFLSLFLSPARCASNPLSALAMVLSITPFRFRLICPGQRSG